MPKYSIVSTADEFSILSGLRKITAIFKNDEAVVYEYVAGELTSTNQVHPEDAIAQVLSDSGVFEKVS